MNLDMAILPCNGLEYLSFCRVRCGDYLSLFEIGHGSVFPMLCSDDEYLFHFQWDSVRLFRNVQIFAEEFPIEDTKLRNFSACTSVCAGDFLWFCMGSLGMWLWTECIFFT